MTKTLLTAITATLLLASPACGSKTSNEPPSASAGVSGLGGNSAAAGQAGTAGAAGGHGGMSTGGSAGQSTDGGMSGTAGQSGTAGRSGMAGDGGAGQSGTAGQSSSGGSGGATQCTIGGTQCESGYHCACGGPGPGVCTCHKECNSAADCDAQNSMCGCSANDTAPRICVNACFCLCG